MIQAAVQQRIDAGGSAPWTLLGDPPTAKSVSRLPSIGVHLVCAGPPATLFRLPRAGG